MCVLIKFQEWKDPELTWNPSEFSDTKEIRQSRWKKQN